MKKQTWICDTCGQEIKEAEHGWVEWLTARGDGHGRSSGLRLVHHNKYSPKQPPSYCSYNAIKESDNANSSVCDQHLTGFLGSDGLMELLTFLHTKEFADEEEVLQMIKRLHVPGYEQAFPHINEAIAEGVFEPNGPVFYVSKNQIDAVIEWTEQKQQED